MFMVTFEYIEQLHVNIGVKEYAQNLMRHRVHNWLTGNIKVE